MPNRPKPAAPKPAPLAAAVAAAVAPANEPTAADMAAGAQVDPQIAQDFNLVGQYVRDNIAKEAPATQMVMGQVLTEALERLKKALGG